MDRKTLLALGVCFLILIGWQKFYIEPKTSPQRQTVQQQVAAVPVAAQTTQPVLQASAAGAQNAVAESRTTARRAPKTASFDTFSGKATVSEDAKLFSGWVLKNYRTEKKDGAPNIELKHVTHQEGDGEVAFDATEFAYLAGVQGRLVVGGQEAKWEYEDDKILFSRTMAFDPAKPYVDLTISAQFKTRRPSYMFVSLASRSPVDDPEAQDRQLLYWSNKSIERVQTSDEVKLVDITTPVKWIGAASRYFTLTVVNRSQVEPRGLVQQVVEKTGRASLVYQIGANSISVPVRVFFGPKKLDLLRSVDTTLDTTVDFGWFTVIAYPLLKMMNWFYHVFGNYGVSIILLTIVVNIITYPLTYKSMKGMREMSRIQPQLQKLREKHKDDKEALNREMLSLMKSHGYNPMAGCWPILVQMPVFIALYRVLYSAVELYQAPFMLWMQDLSAKDPYYVTPVLMSLLMFLQQKMTPNTATDPTQAKMMQFMPLIFGLFMLTLPSGLTVYMLVNSLVGILRQYYLNKKFGITNVPATPAPKPS